MGKPKATPLPPSAPPPKDRLLLSEGFITWNDPELVEKAKAAERSYSKNKFPSWIPYRLVPDHELRQQMPGRWMGGEPYDSGLTEAWAALERSFRDMVGRAQLFLEGVLIKPYLTEHYQPIPGLWASSLKFDFSKSQITIRERQYATVRVSLTPIPVEATGAADTRTFAPPNWAFETMGEWSDDQVLALFEEHVKRVIESEPAKLSAAMNKLSLMPIIIRKMRARFEAKDNEHTLAAEAEFLAAWIKQKAPSLDYPKASSIETKLRSEYRALKAGAKPNN